MKSYPAWGKVLSYLENIIYSAASPAGQGGSEPDMATSLIHMVPNYNQSIYIAKV